MCSSPLAPCALVGKLEIRAPLYANIFLDDAFIFFTPGTNMGLACPSRRLPCRPCRLPFWMHCPDSQTAFLAGVQDSPRIRDAGSIALSISISTLALGRLGTRFRLLWLSFVRGVGIMHLGSMFSDCLGDTEYMMLS